MNNLETELRRIEFSNPDDRIGYEKHSYNGFKGIHGSESYCIHLDKFYSDYLSQLNENIETLLINDRDSLLKFLSHKITLFANIKADFETKNYINWNDHLRSQEKYFSDALKNNSHAKNEYETVRFFKEMTDTQLYFINKIIDELQQTYNSYNPNSEPQKISHEQIDKETWANTLSDYRDILNTFDLAKIFKNDATTIRRWVKEGVLTPIDRNKRPMQFKKDDIKKYYLKIKS